MINTKATAVLITILSICMSICPQALAVDYSLEGDKKVEREKAAIKEAARDYEAMAVRKMLQNMYEGIDPDPMFGGGETAKIYQDMLLDEYSKIISAGNGIGIARDIERYMLKKLEKKNDESTQTVKSSSIQRGVGQANPIIKKRGEVSNQ